MNPPRTGEGDRPKGGGGGSAHGSRPPPSAAGAPATSPSRGGSDRIALAAVAGAHGVRGEVRLKLFTDNVENVALHETVFLGGVERQLESVRPATGGGIARFAGVADRSAAEALRGSLIEVERTALPPLEQGEFYHSDLIGLPCFDREGTQLGRVASVENFGAGDLLDVELEDGKRSLIPFTPGVADLADGRVILDPEFLA